MIVSCVVSADDVPELLIPVTGAEKRRVVAENGYAVREHAYFARRYRIVKVNFDALLDAKSFRVSLFDDESLTVTQRSLVHSDDGATFHWEGLMEDQDEFTVDDLMQQGFPQEQAKEMYFAMVGVTIPGIQYVFDRDTHRSRPLADIDPATGQRAHTIEAARNQAGSFVIGAEFSPPILSTTFRLLALESDRRYYLFLEVDPQKRLTPGMFRQGGPYDEQDMAYRRRLYEQYIESLGEPPPGMRDLCE